MEMNEFSKVTSILETAKFYSLVGGVLLFLTACANSTALPGWESNLPKQTFASQDQHEIASSQNRQIVGSKAALSDRSYSRQPLNLVDQVPAGSDFYKFRQRLRQAVRERDARFIHAIADPKIRLTVGRPRTIDNLNLSNPNAPIWLEMEKIFSAGCSGSTKPETWICPHVFRAMPQNLDAFEYVAIVGKDVNVRLHPSIKSPVVGSLSNEAVKRNRQVGSQPDSHSPNAWTAIIAPNGQPGYVLNRYVYSPIGYRSTFIKTGKDWKMVSLIAGD